MHIAVVAADLIPEQLGGAETHLVEVMGRLAKRGHEFEVFVGPSDDIQRSLPSRIRIHPIQYHKIANLHGVSYILTAPGKIQKQLTGIEIDLIWAKQVYPQGVVGAILAKNLKKPLFTTAQNPLDYKEELVMKGPILFKHVWPNLLTPLVSFALRRSVVVACVSRYAEEQARKLGARRTTIIPNGVDTKQFKVQTFVPSSGRGSVKRKVNKKIRIVTTSALIPRNGLDTLIEAVSLLPKNIAWGLVIAGGGPDAKKLKTQSSKLKVSTKVRLIGRLENRDIPQLLSDADLFVRLSRKEGFGVSFLEAMAAGLPIVATPVGGITDFIKEGETGLLVEPDHPKEAAKAIERLLTDAVLYQKLRKNGRWLVEKRYNWDRIADEVDNVFTSIS